MKQPNWMDMTRRAGLLAAGMGVMALATTASAAPRARPVQTAKAAKTANGTKDWGVVLVPASLVKDHTVHLVQGHVQLLLMAIQASQRVRARGESHQIKVELNMPAGMTLLNSPGDSKVLSTTPSQKDGRSLVTLELAPTNGQLNGTPGAQIRGDGRGQKLFVSVPKSIEPNQAYIEVRLNDGQETQSWRWPIVLSELTPPTQRPKHIVLGLWSYAFGVAGNASNGIGQLFSDSGIRYVEQDESAVFRDAMKAHGILVGGHMYYGLFYDRRAEDQNAAGKELKGDFPNPQAIAELPPGTTLPGVNLMIQRAKQGSGMATMDYEPNGTKGWAPQAVAKFKQQYNLTDAQVKQLRDYVAKHAPKTFLSTDPQIRKMWADWTAFGTAQAASYVQRLQAGLKAGDPNAKLVVTCGPAFGADSKVTLARGGDDVAMAQYADIIMPQMYLGYGAAPVKLLMQWAEGWRNIIDQNKYNSQLWPLLLIRYTGATPYNTPERIREQIIGSIASGAQGAVLFYPANMDATYWTMMARTTEDVAKYEDFYLHGKRVEKQFPLTGMPQSEPKDVNATPGWHAVVENPDWNLTAHEVNGQVLLTLFNLGEDKDLTFHVQHPGMHVVNSENVQAAGQDSWRVPANSVGFVTVSVGQ